MSYDIRFGVKVEGMDGYCNGFKLYFNDENGECSQMEIIKAEGETFET